MHLRARHALRVVAVLALLLLVALATARPLRGCAVIGGKVGTATIADESALIIWDSATQTQHFIRTASFQAKGNSADFGFVVPTPTQPTLAEAGNEVFDALAAVIKPGRKEAIEWLFYPFLCCPVMMLGSNASMTFNTVGVRILHTQRVGGYDAVVLEADNGKDLNEWLGKNGYVSRPEFVDWLDHYAKAKWKITAFKIADTTPPGGVPTTSFKSVSSGTVRMSFKTPKPFFPYREPADSSIPSGPNNAGPTTNRYRVMRVFFVGTGRMTGTLGESDGKPWPAQIRWSDRLPDATRAQLAEKLALDPSQFPAAAWMTAFVDDSLRRPEGHDLFFAESADQMPVVPPPIIAYTRTIWIPPDLVLLCVFGGGYVIRRRRQARLTRLKVEQMNRDSAGGV